MTDTANSPDQAVPVGNASHTHLFPGALITFHARGPGPAPNRPVGFKILFTDGSEATAELVVDEHGRAVLGVAGYTTAAGTPIAAKVWGTAAGAGSGNAQILRITRRLAR